MISIYAVSLSHLRVCIVLSRYLLLASLSRVLLLNEVASALEALLLSMSRSIFVVSTLLGVEGSLLCRMVDYGASSALKAVPQLAGVH